MNELATLEQRYAAAVEAIRRAGDEGFEFTDLELNRIAGLPDDWVPLSKRCPKKAGSE